MHLAHRSLPFTVLSSLLLLGALAATASASAATGGLPDNASQLASSQLLSLATSALSSGKSAQALQIYDHVLERDPNDVATLYKRASVRYALGQWTKASEGFIEVLERNPGFGEARIKLGKVLGKVGEYDEARKQLGLIGDSEDEVKTLVNEINSAQAALTKAERAAQLQRWADCVSSSTEAINFSPNSARLRLLRAKCYLHAKEYDSSVGDLARASSLVTALPNWVMLRLSLISAFLLDNNGARELNGEGVTGVKRCLNKDPDDKSCRQVFKALKKLDKDVGKWKVAAEGSRWLEVVVALAGSPASPGLVKVIEAIFESYQKPLKGGKDDEAPLPSTPKNLVHQSPLYRLALSDLCRAYVMLGRTTKATKACEEALAANPDDVWGLVGRGEALIAEEKWQEAVNVLSVAFDKTGKSDREVLGRLQKAQRLLKQSTSKDYYKVLGVSRDADAKTIKRAYRKATLKAHPDKEGGSEEKMAALNEAYEVLSKPELRQRFDNGDDPNDSQGGGQGQPFFHQGGGFAGFPGGGHPFEQFFQQAQGGGGNGHTHTFRWG